MQRENIKEHGDKCKKNIIKNEKTTKVKDTPNINKKQSRTQAHKTWKINSQGNTQPKMKTSMFLFYKNTHIYPKQKTLKIEDDNFHTQKKTKN